jgi:predicted DNA-binding transcriptional regulator AlpA
MHHPLAGQLLTTTQLGMLLGEHRGTVWRKVKAGIYPAPIQISPGRALFVRDDYAPLINRTAENRDEVKSSE